MKVGDKVRFLNAIGGGIVRGFKGKDVVLIEDEDGFDIPILIKECVVIAANNEVQVRQSVQTSTANSSQVVKSVFDEDVPVYETKEGEELTVCLAFLPLDRKAIGSTSYECYLINDSNYYLNYTYLNRTVDGWNLRSVGLIEPNTKVFVEEFGKEELNDLEKVCAQLFAYKTNKTFKIKNIYSVEIRLDTVKFYKLHSFKENDYFDEDALLYTLIRKDIADKQLLISPQELEQAMKEKSQSERLRKSPVKKENKPDIIEVDLHITELLDNTTGLDAAAILDYQLTKFRDVLEENRLNKSQKIVFIHGKGNGVLKKELLNELRNKYKSYYTQDASFREYGFGATMVTIK